MLSFEKLVDETKQFVCEKIGATVYIVVRRIERDRTEENFGLNGEIIGIFAPKDVDSPGADAIQFAVSDFRKVYDKNPEIRLPVKPFARSFGVRQPKEGVIVKFLHDGSSSIYAIKYVVYLLRAEEIANLLVQGKEMFYDLTAYPQDVARPKAAGAAS